MKPLLCPPLNILDKEILLVAKLRTRLLVDLHHKVIFTGRLQEQFQYRPPVVTSLKSMANDVLHIIAHHLAEHGEFMQSRESRILTPSKVTLNFSFSTTKPGFVARAGANPVANPSIPFLPAFHSYSPPTEGFIWQTCLKF